MELAAFALQPPIPPEAAVSEMGSPEASGVVYSSEMAKQPKSAETEHAGRHLIPDWLKIALAVITSVLVVGAWVLIQYLPARIDSQTTALREDVSGLKADMGSVKQSVERIDRTINDLLKVAMEKAFSAEAGGQASLKEDLELGQRLARIARDMGYKVDPQIVAQAGISYLEIAAEKPPLRHLAWNAATELINYRSYLNATAAVMPPMPATTLAGPGMVVSPGSMVENLAFEGGTYTLNGAILKDVVFRNARIRFVDGPIHLENVYFQNCTLEIRFSTQRTKLGCALLASAAVSVRLPS